MHDPSRGQGPCGRPDGHKGQHYSEERMEKRREYQRGHRAENAIAAARYRYRHPVKRALTVVRQNADRRRV
jgi:hypothetical protein